MNSGAYRLFLRLPQARRVAVGRLGLQRFPAGTYVYVGSAQRGLEARVMRHVRLVTTKAGNRHWHVDALLLEPSVRLVRAEAYAGADECRLSAHLARQPGVSIPVPGFGATDCSAGCLSHLYRIDGRCRYAIGGAKPQAIYC